MILYKLVTEKNKQDYFNSLKLKNNEKEQKKE